MDGCSAQPLLGVLRNLLTVVTWGTVHCCWAHVLAQVAAAHVTSRQVAILIMKDWWGLRHLIYSSQSCRASQMAAVQGL